MVALSHKAGQRIARVRRTGLMGVVCGCLMTIGFLTGCSVVVAPEAPPEAPTTTPPTDAPGPPVKAPNDLPKPKAAKQPEQAPDRVAIIYAQGVPSYKRIAEALVARIPSRARAFPLVDDAKLRLESQNDEYGQVVAIGVLAARTARELSDKPLVFCQAFNFRDYGLIEKHMMGISMLPPAEQQFAAWGALASDAKRIGVITGPGHERLIAQARTAARLHGMELIDRIAHTDKETLFEFKRLVPGIDGLWLVPDERILSHRVLRELMAYSARHRKLVLAFAPELLEFGALMSASGVEADIVDQLLVALDESARPVGEPTFRLLPLTRAHIEINAELARSLGYSAAQQPGLSDVDVR